MLPARCQCQLSVVAQFALHWIFEPLLLLPVAIFPQSVEAFFLLGWACLFFFGNTFAYLHFHYLLGLTLGTGLVKAPYIPFGKHKGYSDLVVFFEPLLFAAQPCMAWQHGFGTEDAVQYSSVSGVGVG